MAGFASRSTLPTIFDSLFRRRKLAGHLRCMQTSFCCLEQPTRSTLPGTPARPANAPRGDPARPLEQCPAAFYVSRPLPEVGCPCRSRPGGGRVATLQACKTGLSCLLVVPSVLENVMAGVARLISHLAWAPMSTLSDPPSLCDRGLGLALLGSAAQPSIPPNPHHCPMGVPTAP